jgi:hypothetical protein
MRLFFKSATKTEPEASTAMDQGQLKVAAAPTPSAAPATPPPASRLTAPLGEIDQTRFVSGPPSVISETKTVPKELTATPYGWLKLDARVEDVPATDAQVGVGVVEGDGDAEGEVDAGSCASAATSPAASARA